MLAAHTVRTGLTPDGAVVMDITNGQMVGMNPVGSLIWQQLNQNHSTDEIAQRLVRDFHISPERALNDVNVFVTQLEARELISGLKPKAIDSETTNNAKSLLSQPISGVISIHEYYWNAISRQGERESKRQKLIIKNLFFQAYLLLVYFDVYLARGNFRALYDRVRIYPLSKGPPLNSVERICSAVDMACIWYWKEALCLQRSAAATCLLKRQGIPAHMVVGAQQMPFKAHAWVEVDGRVVNDKPYTPARYHVIDRF